jgi:hypothetical protein
MAAVRMVKAPVDEVVQVVCMRYPFVAAAVAVNMATRLGRTAGRIPLRFLNPALVEMIAMQAVQAAVVEIIDMAVVPDGGVPASISMNVRVIAVDWVSGHTAFRLAEGGEWRKRGEQDTFVIEE